MDLRSLLIITDHQTAIDFYTWKVSTLDPRQLTPECYVDLSGQSSCLPELVALPSDTIPSALPASQSPKSHGMAYRGQAPPWNRSSFPPGTAGFLYYHAPPPGGHPLGGEVRFRLTQDQDPSSFASGEDLLLPYGTPWNVRLIPYHGAAPRFQDMLVQDGFITHEHIERMVHLTQGLSIEEQQRMRYLLYAFKQPFSLRLDAGNGDFSNPIVISTLGTKDGQDVIRHMEHKLHSGHWAYQQTGAKISFFTKPGRCFSLLDASASNLESHQASLSHLLSYPPYVGTITTSGTSPSSFAYTRCSRWTAHLTQTKMPWAGCLAPRRAAERGATNGC